MTSLAKKLRLKPGHRAALLNAPAGYRALLEPLPEGVELVEHAEGVFDFILLFVHQSSELEALLPAVQQSIKDDAVLWICYPKAGKRAGTDLNRDILRDAVLERGLSGVSLVAIDDTWSAMRFRPSERVGS